MAATDARPVPRKNVAWRLYFAIRKNDGTLITSWTGADSEVSLDGASFSDCTNEATEISTSGCGYLDLTSSEMNADSVLIKITVTNTSALPLVIPVFPEEAGDYRLSATPPTAAETASQVRTELSTELARIDATIGSRLASASYVSPATPTNVSDAQTAILAKLPAALVSGRMDVAVGAYQSGMVPLQPLVAGRQIAVSATTGKVTSEAVELDSASVTAVQSGLATSASITTLRGADNDTLKTLSDQIDGISSGGTDWTANERTAIRSILGVPASGTTPADPSVGILDTIRDSIGTYIAGISAVASTTTGTIVGFPSSLNIGDSYTEEANSDIHVFIRDENDDPITAVGNFTFADPEFAPEVNITQSGSTGRVKAVVTFVDATPEDYLKVEIPSSQSRRASPGTATIQCLLKWVDTDGKVLAQKTLTKQAVTWNEMV